MNGMATHKWTALFLVWAAVGLQLAAAATTPSLQEPKKISVTDWIRIITHPATRSTDSPSLLFNIFDDEDDSGENKTQLTVQNLTLINDGSNNISSGSNISALNSTTETPARPTREKPVNPALLSTARPSGPKPASKDNAGTTTTTTPMELASDEDKALADFTRMLELLQRAGGFLPELRDVLMRGQGLTQDQTQQLMNLTRQFGDTLSSLPDSLQSINSTLDVIKLLQDSGLLQSLTNIGSPSTGTASQGSRAAGSAQPHTVHWLKCQVDLLAMITALGNQQMWALKMLDAWGKPESSLLRGNTMFLGNNAECTSVHHTDTQTFVDIQGRTCRMNIYLESLRSPLFGDQIIPIILDTCLPHSCESMDLNSALMDLNSAVNESGFPYITMTCTAELDIGNDPWAIVAVIILSIFLALMVAGTLTELCIESKPRRQPDFINAFTSNNGGADLVNGGVNGITPNGRAGNPYGQTNGGFEMRDVGYITAGGDVKTQSNNGHIMQAKKNAEPGGLSGQPETKVDEDKEKNSSGLPNGDYTDDLNSYYPYGQSIKTNGSISDPYTVDKHIHGAVSQPGVAHRIHDHNKAGTSSKGDDTAYLPKWQRLLLAFSLPRNTGKILGVKAGPGSIACLHGIRVLSMGWVIFGHVLSFSGQMGNFKNKLDMFDLLRGFTFQVMANGTLSVDSFFFMSGLLTAYMFLKECGKQEKVTLKQGILYYVHRYWRLTPPMMIWILIVACLIQYVGEGRPGWDDYYGAQLCRDNWWANMLYIQNLYTEKSGCIGVTWYLANDMQFYFLAPLVVLPWIYRKPIIGFVMAALLIAIHLASNLWLVYEYNFDVFRTGEDGGYMEKLYVKPWARVGPFAIGLVMGYILWRTKCKMHINKYLVAIGWILSMAAMLTVTLVTYDENKDPINDPDGWPVAGKMIHETFSRPVWALVLSWIVLACSTGHGGFINSILSWEGFLPLSRMTYCAYLVHLTVLGYEFMVPDSTFLYTMTNLIYRFFGMYVMSYAVAFLLAVGVEAPMLGLEKVALAH